MAKKFLTKVKESLYRITGLEMPHWSSSLIWGIGVIIMVGLTVKYLCPIVSDYFDEERNVEVKIAIRRNDTVERPQFFLCIPRLFYNLQTVAFSLEYQWKNRGGIKCDDCEALVNQSWDVWNHGNISSNKHEQDFTVEKIQNRFIERIVTNPDDFIINKTEYHWQKPIISAIFDYLKNKIKAPDKNIYTGNIWETSISYINLTNDHLEILMSKIAGYFCDYIDFYLHNRTKCLKMLENGFVRETFYDFCFQLSDEVDFVNIDEQYFKNWIGSGDGNILVYTENPALGKHTQELLRIHTESLNLMTFPITYSLLMKVIEERVAVRYRCFEEKSKTDCLLSCSTEEIVKACSCIPFTTREFVPDFKYLNLPFCTQEYYQNCYNATINPLKTCQQKCTDPCEYHFYQWDLSPEYLNRDRGLSWSIHPTARPYLELIMRDKDGPEDFIASIGGQFNFFLGMSGLTLIFFLTLLLDWIRRWNGLKTNSSVLSATSALSVGLQWRWLAMKSGQGDNSNPKKMEEVLVELENVKMQLRDVDEFRKKFDEMENIIKELKFEINKCKSKKEGDVFGNDTKNQTTML